MNPERLSLRTYRGRVGPDEKSKMGWKLPGTLETDNCEDLCQSDSEVSQRYSYNVVPSPTLPEEDLNPSGWTQWKVDIVNRVPSTFCALGSSCRVRFNQLLDLSRWTQRHKLSGSTGRSRVQTEKPGPKLCHRQKPPCPSLLTLLLVTLLSTSFGSLAARARGGLKHRVPELRCPPCRQIHCAIKDPKVLGCKGGVTTGVCGCCPACARLAGQSCGGDLSYLGKCDQGLRCQPTPRPSSLPAYRMQREPPGECVKGEDALEGSGIV